MTQAPDRLMTAEELLDLPDDGKQYELVRGKLICMAGTSTLPAVVALNVASELRVFVRQHKLGICGGADWGFILARDPDVVRLPDGAFVRSERVPATGIPPGFWAGPPDAAVEVVSPSDRFKDVMEKAQDYMDAGTRLLWVIDPEARRAWVFRPGTVTRSIDENGVLDGEDVLPGFSLPLRDVLV